MGHKTHPVTNWPVRPSVSLFLSKAQLVARIGHASPRAALIYQHATAERDRAIASFLDDQIATAERPALASVVGFDGPPVGLLWGWRSNGCHPVAASAGPDLRKHLEVAAGIEPAYRALQALA